MRIHHQVSWSFIAKSHLAYVSWHHRYSQIAVHFGLSRYHGIISLQIAVYFGSPMYHGIIGILISLYTSVLPKYHGIGIHPISSKISLSSHVTARLSIMPISVSEPSSHLHFGSESRAGRSPRLYPGSVNRTISSARLISIMVR